MTDYTLNPHVWNKIPDKMNEMAEEDRLIKQAVLGTYERMKGNYSKLRNNAKDDNGKQVSQSGKRSVQFKSNVNTGTNHPPTVTHSGNAMCSILKLSPNLATRQTQFPPQWRK